jgi:hypothetical protein
MRTSLRSLGGIKLRRRPLRRQPEPRDSIDPETLRQLAGKWVARASSDGANYEIIASGDELGDVLARCSNAASATG